MNNRKICFWCKYGQEEADKLIKEKPMTMDCQQCPKCGNTCVSGSHLVDE